MFKDREVAIKKARRANPENLSGGSGLESLGVREVGKTQLERGCKGELGTWKAYCCLLRNMVFALLILYDPCIRCFLLPPE